ncbi:MAG: hypothetical protein RRY33_06855 [Alistipes sp.]
MRKFMYGIAAIIVCAAMCSACSSDSTEEGGKTGDGMAKLLTFGFYAADNAGLKADYVAEIAPEMVIRLPADAAKTALVARFTTSENDKVLVGSKEQVSGTSANDFTYPIDYLVSDADAKLSSRYTIKVGKILTKVWAEIAAYNDKDATSGALLPNDEFAMAISPKDNTPYFFLARTASDVDAGVVVKLENGTPTAGSEISFASDGTTRVDVKYPQIAIDVEGKVYASYYYTTDQKMFVKTGSGSSWSMVGTPFGNVKCSSYTTMEIDPATKHPIVAYYANSAIAGTIARRDMNLCYFDGAAWSSENLISDLSAKSIYNSTMRIINNTLYLGGTVQNKPGSYFVYKYNNGSWEKIINALPADASQTNIVGFSFDIASDGTVYICAGGDEDVNKTWKPTVYKAAPGATDWTRVATPLNFDVASSSKYTMELYEDRPIVFYREPVANMPTIVMLNAATKQWEEPLQLGTTAMTINDLHLEFDANGIGYAAFLDDSANKALHIYKYAMEADDLGK